MSKGREPRPQGATAPASTADTGTDPISCDASSDWRNNGDQDRGKGLELYQHQISSLVGLKAQEERQLLARVRSGDLEAVDKMVVGHLGLVGQVLKEGPRKDRDTLELYEQGNLALLRAIVSFHSGRKQGFRAYARSVVRSVLGNADDPGVRAH